MQNKCENCSKEFCTALDLAAHRYQQCDGQQQQQQQQHQIDNDGEMHGRSATTAKKQSNRPLSQCNICLKFFTFKSNLTLHLRTVHDLRDLYKCDECGKHFEYRRQLTLHRATHVIVNAAERYPCPLCDRTFSSLQQLRSHQSNMHSGEFQCNFCDMTFSTKSDFFEHRNVHTDQMHKCEHCDRTFWKKSNLYSHQRSAHLNIRRFKCNECGKRYPYRSHLRKHMKSHHPELVVEEKYECWCCHKTWAPLFFLSNFENKRKIIITSCSHCSFDLHRCLDFWEHICWRDTLNCVTWQRWRWTGPTQAVSTIKQTRRMADFHDRKFCCFVQRKDSYVNCVESICPKWPVSKGTWNTCIRMNDHWNANTVDSGKVVNICLSFLIGFALHSLSSISINRFKTRHALMSHLTVHADFQFKCSQCDKMFRKKDFLRRHMAFHMETKVKPHACDFCEKSFRRIPELRVCSKKNFWLIYVILTIRDNSRPLQEHRRIHTGERPYTCEHCSSNFRTASSYYAHLRKTHGMPKFELIWSHNG